MKNRLLKLTLKPLLLSKTKLTSLAKTRTENARPTKTNKHPRELLFTSLNKLRLLLKLQLKKFNLLPKNPLSRKKRSKRSRSQSKKLLF